MKLLIIDDNKDITDVMMVYCDSKGLDCTVINDGNDGLNLIRNSNDFDLIMLDLAMPDFSEKDIINSLKKDNLLDERNIVVFTASDRKVLEEIRNGGVKAIFKKPFSVDELTALIEKFRKNY
jgi:DNA-binding response OmpR family regulator